ncbi:MAG: PHP domain-containing protein, partial [Actinobacteria bacterium]|nr:PHP domain-containing protein [Actinomycetota bacterium]
MNNFVHLNCHSNFSLLFGGSSIEELVSRCAELEMGALALTDRDGLYGAVRFFEAAEEAGIKPIVGCDLEVGRGTRLILIAENDEGYRNLCRSVTESRLGGSPLSFDRLVDYSDGLFALLGDPGSLEEARAVFPDHLYAELANTGTRESHREADALIGTARRLGVPCVASNRVAFAGPGDYQLHRTLSAIRTIRPVTRIPPVEVADEGCHLKPPAEMEKLFSAYPYSEAPEAIPNTGEIAGACDFRFNLGGRLFPAADLPPGETAFSYLTKLCFEGTARRYRPLPADALERLHMELKTIESLGFTPYFLVVHDIAKFCRERGIPAAGRGSAA